MNGEWRKGERKSGAERWLLNGMNGRTSHTLDALERSADFLLARCGAVPINTRGLLCKTWNPTCPTKAKTLNTWNS